MKQLCNSLLNNVQILQDYVRGFVSEISCGKIVASTGTQTYDLLTHVVQSGQRFPYWDFISLTGLIPLIGSH